MLKRLGFSIPKQDCEDIANTKPGAIERVLKLVKFKMAKFQEKHGVAQPGATVGLCKLNVVCLYKFNPVDP